MQFTPHNYQAYCIQRVVEDPAIGLFLRPGLGKTVITLSAINIEDILPDGETAALLARYSK